MVFQPIAFKTQLGQARYYLFSPFGYLNQGCNSKIAKVKSVVSRVCARSGTFVLNRDDMVPKWTSKYIAHRAFIGDLQSDQQGDSTMVPPTQHQY